MLKELGLAFEHVPTNFFDGSTHKPEFLAINPNGRVPALDDDGLLLWESLAINLYLARKYGGSLAPETPGLALSLMSHATKNDFACKLIGELGTHARVAVPQLVDLFLTQWKILENNARMEIAPQRGVGLSPRDVKIKQDLYARLESHLK